MTPYYEDDSVTIYHGDCRELDFTADAIVTDPPYGTGYYATDSEGMAPEMLARFVAAMPTAVFGYAEKLVPLLAAAGVAPSEWVTWWPTNAACRGVNYNGLRREAEHIAFFGVHHLQELRQARTSVNSQRMIALGDKRPASKSRPDFQGEKTTKRFGDVWTDAAPGLAFNSKKRLHPNEKPVALMARIVEGISREGQTVLDPFMGSGSTLVAARSVGRKAIGVEIDEKFCEVAANRFAQATLQLPA